MGGVCGYEESNLSSRCHVAEREAFDIEAHHSKRESPRGLAQMEGGRAVCSSVRSESNLRTARASCLDLGVCLRSSSMIKGMATENSVESRS